MNAAAELRRELELSGLEAAEEKDVMFALSQFVGDVRGERSLVGTLSRVIAAVSGRDVLLDDGGERLERSIPEPMVTMRRLGISDEELDTEWALLSPRVGLLPRELLEEFVPMDLWPAIAEVIENGPDEFAAEVEDLLRLWAKGLASDGKPRRDGALGRITLEGRVTAAWKFMHCCCAVRRRRRRYRTELFEEWTKDAIPARPDVERLDPKDDPAQRTAPDLIIVRRTLRALDQRVSAGKRTKQGRSHLFTALRNRVIVALIVVLGIRVSAVRNLVVEDFNAEHHFEDGVVGPALAVRAFRGSRKNGSRPYLRSLLRGCRSTSTMPASRPGRSFRRGNANAATCAWTSSRFVTSSRSRSRCSVTASTTHRTRCGISQSN